MTEINNTEIELKFDLQNESNYRKLLETVAIDSQPVRQSNRFFDTDDDLLETNRLALRLREEPQRSYFTLKGPRTASKEGLASREELESPADSTLIDSYLQEGITAEQLPDIIRNRIKSLIKEKRLSFKLGFVNDRTAVPFRIDDIELTLEIDHTLFPDGSSDYELEIEISDESEYEKVREKVEEILRNCGISPRFQPKSKIKRAVERSSRKIT